MLLQVVLLHLAGGSEQLVAPRDGAEEEDQVLMEQTVNLERHGVGETAATLITIDSDISSGRIFCLPHLLCVLLWMTFLVVKEGSLGILQLNWWGALITLEERGSRSNEAGLQLLV